MPVLKRFLKYVLALFFVAAGVTHFVNPAVYVGIVPGYLPAPLLLVYLSGAFEILLGAMLLVPRWSAVAGWGLILLLLAVFPANLHMAMNPQRYPAVSCRVCCSPGHTGTRVRIVRLRPALTADDRRMKEAIDE